MWTPNQETLNHLIILFQQSNNGSKTQRDARIAARQQLESAKSQPDLVNYLLYLLLNDVTTEEIRATSGLWLKNLVQSNFHNLSGDSISYLQQHSTAGLADKSHLIRNTSSILVTNLLSKLTLENWPALLPELVNAISTSKNGDFIQEGAVSALKNICEDSASVVAKNSQLTLELVPKLIEFTKSDSARVRSYSVSCLTEFVPLGSIEFLKYINEFLLSCFELAQSDSSPETLQSICRAFTELLQVRPDILVPHMQGVVQFAVHCVQMPQEEMVALEGAEFLLALSESEADEETLKPFLPTVLGPLLSGMVFSDEDLFVLESLQEDDHLQVDKDEDVKPLHPKHKRRHGTADLDEDDDDDDLESSLENWNLRKCCATAVDQFAQKAPHQVLQLVLPILLQRINDSQEWPVRESAVLAFGAISTGAKISGELQFVSELVPFLVELLKNEHASIREISCWTLSRYVDDQSLNLELLKAVLQCMLDVNKRVQAAACACLSTLSEQSNGMLEPLANDLLQHLSLCFARYQRNNLLALYECVQVVSTSISNAIKINPEISDLVMQPMMERWKVCANEDYEFLALLETLSFMAMAIGPYFSKYAGVLFERSVLLLREGLVLMERAHLDANVLDDADPLAIACAIDLIDGLVQALGSDGMDPLFAMQKQSTQTSIVDLLLMGLNSGMDNLEIKQSCLSLLGDLSIYCFDSQVLPYCEQVVHDVVQLIDEKVIANDAFYEPVGDNAMWTLAEISMHHQKFSLSPYFNEIFPKLGSVLCSTEIYSTSVLWNAAIALGRLGLGSAQLLAPHLHMFIDKYLEVMVDVDATSEKDTSLQGICMAIAANPSALNNERLTQFFKVLATYFTPSAELKDLVKKVYVGYKSMLPVDQLIGSLPTAFQQQLKVAYIE